LASFDNGHFTSPQGISRVPLRFTNNAAYGIPYLYTADRWSNTTGLRGYLPGADIINLSMQETSNSFNFSFTLTNKCHLKAEIIKYWNNDVLYTFCNNDVMSAGNFSYTINKSILNTNEFRFRISAIPYYNSYYGDYQQNWKTYIIKYPENIFAPIISSFTQSPTPIYRGDAGVVTCVLSQGNGNITYEWSYSGLPEGVSVSFEGNRAVIVNNQNKI
ncbi:hypothetical protein KKB64_03580, partial [Patescibacteria group bacterium]|nr:hypothetical protein [Patescibacteria group bacterium]